MIAVCLNVHENEVVADTVESIKKYVSNDILLVVDGAKWNLYKDLNLGTFKLNGFYHNHSKSPYRNVALGLMHTYLQFPKAEWYLYTEYDAIFASDTFKIDLENAKKRNTWCLGSNYNHGLHNIASLGMFGISVQDQLHSLYGCCVFYHRCFVEQLMHMEFFDKILFYTNPFEKGFFPQLDENNIWDLSEVLYPTMVAKLGGNVEGLSSYDHNFKMWQGCHRKYKIRDRHEIRLDELTDDVSIVHPSKSMNKVREFLKSKR